MTEKTPKTSEIRQDPLAILKLLPKDEDGQDRIPPVEKWNPPFCGDINMEIKRNGQWFYQGTPIGRPALVKLFSRVLRRDGDDFFLVTPVEKVGIKVEDAPFLAITVEWVESEGLRFLCFTTQTGDKTLATADNPIRVFFNEQQEPSPYIEVRARLDALISRNVYYQLVEWGTLKNMDGQEQLMIASGGVEFCLGSC